MLRSKTLTFDLESFPNLFLLSMRYRDHETGSVKNKKARCKDISPLLPIFQASGVWHVGFNSAGYDDIMLAMYFLLGDRATDELMYEFNQRIIMGYTCPTALCEHLYSTHVKEFDYYTKAGRKFRRTLSETASMCFGGKNRRSVDLLLLNEGQGSLKNAEIVMCRDIRETPVAFGTWLTEEQKQDVEDYCFDDVDATEAVYDTMEPQMLVRDRFYESGIQDAHNIGSAKLGEKYMVRRLCGETKPPVPPSPAEGIIPVSEMLAYEYKYFDPEFHELARKLSSASMHYGRELAAWGDVEPPDEDPEFSKKEQLPSPFSIDSKFVAKGELVFTDARGMTYTFGVGGLHNDAPSGVWVENDEWCIDNVDVGSYYPTLMAKKGFVARHLPGFVEVTAAMITERFAAKKAKHVDADTLKLVLNATFGKMRERFSKIFDPKAHFSITINGQLMLMTLIDLVYNCSSSQVINANTDGVCFYVRRDELDVVREAYKAWEEWSKGCVLEEEMYEAWAQSNCNNYVAKTCEGKLKMKGGAYKVKSVNLKDVDKTSKAEKAALIGYLINDINPRDLLTRLAQTNPMAFCTVESAGGEKVQFVCNGKATHKKKLRFVVAKTGGDRYEKITYSKVGKVSKKGEVSEGLSKACGGHLAVSIGSVSEIKGVDIDVEHYVLATMMRVIGSYATWSDNKEKLQFNKLLRKEGVEAAFKTKQWRVRV